MTLGSMMHYHRRLIGFENARHSIRDTNIGPFEIVELAIALARH